MFDGESYWPDTRTGDGAGEARESRMHSQISKLQQYIHQRIAILT